VGPNLEEIEKTALAEIRDAADLAQLDLVRVKYLGKKADITLIQKGMGQLPEAERRETGQKVNAARAAISGALDARKNALEEAALAADIGKPLDGTLPGDRVQRGALHPVSRVIQEISTYFHGMGFKTVDGPELETDHYNFEALNIPADHPARDMQDTFFIEDEWLLRKQTSNVQIRVMENQKPPLRIIAPGRVYRRDNDATHSPMFHQVEGFLVDENVTFANLKYVLTGFVRAIFGEKRKLRFRPSFFPFTEPSAEVDMDCMFCEGAGCRVCKGSGWIEILGSGMIHPNVLRGVGIDPEKYSGFAFGVGVDRVAMLKFGVPNIRLLFENDVRFLEQFR
jgi:phenylalanyl-tRNA synthetase alpha chain